MNDDEQYRALSASLASIAAETMSEPHRLPDARVIWLRAQYVHRQSVARSREIVRYAFASLALIAVAVLVVTRLDSVRPAIEGAMSRAFKGDVDYITIAIIATTALVAWSLAPGTRQRR
ncbi:MAG: hypothetical protein H7X80_02925 [bacterium]|nr:hypothetical protein [Candidatus Kapabacteria bacterium]